MRDKVFHIISGLNNGGAEAVLFRLVTNDTANRHTIISLMDLGKYGPLLQEQGIQVYCLNMPKGKVKLAGLFRLWCLLRNYKPQVVQTWMYHADFLGGLVAKFVGIKKIVWNIRHTDLVPGQSSRATILIAKLCAKLSGFIPNKIVCCAEKAAQVHADLGYNKEKMLVIGNGYLLDQFKPHTAARTITREILGITDNQPLLGMVGRFNAQKDHKNLLAALGLLKAQGVLFNCALIGSDIDNKNSELMAWVAENKLQESILLLGQRTDIPALMNALDVHLLSSSFGEAFPNVLAEAMACGTPCVTTDVGDAALIVGSTGWVVPPQNSQVLATAIQEALEEQKNTPKGWQTRKHNARKHIEENFSIEVMVGKYREVWGGA